MADDAIAPKPKRLSAPARAQRVLASLMAGASVDEISAEQKLTRARTESILRDELRRRWIAPAQEFAKLQIARLEAMIVKLMDRFERGDPQAIDRMLKIVDRLDRYHGFSRASQYVDSYDDSDRARLMKKLNDVAARLQAEKPQE